MKKVLVFGLLGFLLSSQANAQTETLTRCDGPDARACHQQNLKTARKALDRAITDACRKQGAKGGDLMGCRVELMTRTAASIR